jgi:secreted trypsin-like serine protease
MLSRLACLFTCCGLLVLPATANAIVGGQTTHRMWPHMAGMEFKAPDAQDWGLRCGASLVRPDVILTAAHCVDSADGGTEPSASFRFLLGTNRRSAGGERIPAASILEHPGYDASGGSSSDVALVKLASPSTLGRAIRIAGPADAGFWEPGDPAVVTGWGAESSGASDVPDDLKEAEMPIVSDAECQNSYRFTLGFDPATNVCAGDLLGGEDSCQGDSGGPLQVQDGAGAWIQVGVVSYGLGCAFPTQYGVYAEVGGDALRGWIEQTATALAAAPAPAVVPGAATGSRGSAPAGFAVPVVRTRLRLPARLRVTRAGIRVRLGTTAALRSIVVTLKRGRRTLAVGRRASLRGTSGTIRLKRRARLTAGRATLRVTARDASGERVVLTRAVRLTR